MQKIKVVWICHFSNKEIRNFLPLSEQKLSRILMQIFTGVSISTKTDFAPWVSALINEFKRINYVELHVIAPHQGLKKLTFEFESSGIHYHFFRPGFSLVIEKVIKKYIKPNRRYSLNRFLIRRFIAKVKPDIVTLIGSENPYYSLSVLDIKQVPVYVLLQTVLSASTNLEQSYLVNTNLLRKEKEIFQQTRYFGTASPLYHDSVLKINSEAIIFPFRFPTESPPIIDPAIKEYDFVFFSSQLKPSKGVEDSIEALAIVKKYHKAVKLNIIGSCSSAYKKLLESKVSAAGLNENIIFSEHFPSHLEMFIQVSKSMYALLPHKIDVVASTIREAMFMGLPVITYKTSGTPNLNIEHQTVMLSEIGDITDLAKNMITLMNNQELAQNLANNAKNLAMCRYNNTKIAQKLVEDYFAIINHYKNERSKTRLLFI